MALIGYRLNNICAWNVLGWKNEGKTKFIFIFHGCNLSTPRGDIQFIHAAYFCHWRPRFIYHCPWKVGDLSTLVLWMHVGNIQIEIPRTPNGN